MEVRVNHFTQVSTVVVGKLPLTSGLVTYTNVFYKIYYYSFKSLLLIMNTFFNLRVIENGFKRLITLSSLALLRNKTINSKKKINPFFLSKYTQSVKTKPQALISYTIHPTFYNHTLGLYKQSFQPLLGEFYFNKRINVIDNTTQSNLFSTAYVKFPSLLKKLKLRIRKLKYTPIHNNNIKNMITECLKYASNKSKFLKLLINITKILKRRRVFKSLMLRIYNLISAFSKHRLGITKPSRVKLILDKNIMLKVRHQNNTNPYLFNKIKRSIIKPKLTSKNYFVYHVYQYYKKSNNNRRVLKNYNNRRVKTFKLNRQKYVYSREKTTSNPKLPIIYTDFNNHKISTVFDILSSNWVMSRWVKRFKNQSSVFVVKRYKRRKPYLRLVKSLTRLNSVICRKYKYTQERSYKYKKRYFYRPRRRRYILKWFHSNKYYPKFRRFRVLRAPSKSTRLIRTSKVFMLHRFKLYKLSRSAKLLQKRILKQTYRYRRLLVINYLRLRLSRLSFFFRKLVLVKFTKKNLKLIQKYVQKLRKKSKTRKKKKKWLSKLPVKVIKKKKLLKTIVRRVQYSPITGDRVLVNYYRRTQVYSQLNLLNYLDISDSSIFEGGRLVRRFKSTKLNRTMRNTFTLTSYKKSIVLPLIRLKTRYNNQATKQKRTKINTRLKLKKLKPTGSIMGRVFVFLYKSKRKILIKSSKTNKNVKKNKNTTIKVIKKKLLQLKQAKKVFGFKLNKILGSVNTVSLQKINIKSLRNVYNSNKLWFRRYISIPFWFVKLPHQSTKSLVSSVKVVKNKQYLSWKPLNLLNKTLGSLNKQNRSKQKLNTIRTTHKLPFILPSYGFLYITNLLLPDIMKGKSIFYNARRDYSFISMWELKKDKLTRYNKSKSIFKSFFFNKLNPDSLSVGFWESKLAAKTTALINCHASRFNFKFLTKHWLRDDGFRPNLFDSDIFHIKRINIRRIKFKPGYSKIWRTARTTFKQVHGLTFKYQHRLTQYMLEFYRTKIWRTNSFLLFKLINTLNDSLITSDNKTNLFFIKNNWVYVNGHACNNESFVVGVGDFIQLVVHIKYYILYKWLLNWSIVKQNRFKQLIHNRFHLKTRRADKQSTAELPKWLVDLDIRTLDVAKHLEVDYLTLSMFVLFDPLIIDSTYLSKLSDRASLIANMYNWKYIT